MSLPDVMVYQCPVCELWQMDYSMKEMLKAYGQYTISPEGGIVPDMRLFQRTVDFIFINHMETEHPKELASWRRTGKLGNSSATVVVKQPQ